MGCTEYELSNSWRTPVAAWSEFFKCNAYHHHSEKCPGGWPYGATLWKCTSMVIGIPWSVVVKTKDAVSYYSKKLKVKHFTPDDSVFKTRKANNQVVSCHLVKLQLLQGSYKNENNLVYRVQVY
jgi:hypothetical protein